jgi:hypothetical protein
MDQVGKGLSSATGRLLIMAVGILLVGAAHWPGTSSENDYQVGLLLHHVLRDLGIALILSVLLSITVESVFRQNYNDEIIQKSEAALEMLSRRIQNEINEPLVSHFAEYQKQFYVSEKNKINYLLQKRYPEDYWGYLFSLFGSFSFFRDHYRIGIAIEPLIELDGTVNPSLVSYKVDVQYETTNITRETQPLPGVVLVDECWDQRFSHDPRYVGLTYWRVGNRELSDDELAMADKRTTGPRGEIRYEWPGEVLVESGIRKSVSFRLKSVFHRRDRTTWSNNYPSGSTTLTIRYPQDLALYVECKCPFVDGRTMGRNGELEIVLDGGTLPYATFEISWHGTEQPTAQLLPQTTPA